MFRTIIIDDERDAVAGLSLLLKTHCPEVKVIATASSPLDGIGIVRSVEPDLVFLDIEMPHGSGFDVLENFPERDFKTIFTTAYNHYAVKAIKFSALDYLLKPIDADELCCAIDKAKNNSRKFEKEQRIVLFENLISDKPYKLAIPIKDGFQYVPIKHIVRIEGTGSYCTFYMSEGSKLVVSHNLGFYDELLEKNNFYRIHQSHLINLKHIHQYLKTGGGIIIMSDKSSVPISRRNRDGFLKIANISK